MNENNNEEKETRIEVFKLSFIVEDGKLAKDKTSLAIVDPKGSYLIKNIPEDIIDMNILMEWYLRVKDEYRDNFKEADFEDDIEKEI